MKTADKMNIEAAPSNPDPAPVQGRPKPKPAFILLHPVTAQRLKIEAFHDERPPGRLLSYVVKHGIESKQVEDYPPAPPRERGRWERLRVGFRSNNQWWLIESAASKSGKSLEQLLTDAAHYLFPPDPAEACRVKEINAPSLFGLLSSISGGEEPAKIQGEREPTGEDSKVVSFPFLNLNKV